MPSASCDIVVLSSQSVIRARSPLRKTAGAVVVVSPSSSDIPASFRRQQKSPPPVKGRQAWPVVVPPNFHRAAVLVAPDNGGYRSRLLRGQRFTARLAGGFRRGSLVRGSQPPAPRLCPLDPGTRPGQRHAELYVDLQWIARCGRPEPRDARRAGSCPATGHLTIQAYQPASARDRPQSRSCTPEATK